VTEIPKAETTDHFELRTRATALKVNHDASGKVTGVVYADETGRMHEQKARAVAVAGNVVETTRLLLNSASNLFPNGLGNTSGHLGCNYTRHVFSFIFGVMPGPVNMHRGTQLAGLIQDEQYHKPERGFAGGYLLEAMGMDPARAIGLLGGWGKSVSDYIEHYSRLAVVFLCGEDPPQASNCIALHPTQRDQYGLPIPVIKYTMHSNSTAMQHHGINQVRQLYSSLGGTDIRATEGVQIAAHNMGVARMSARPDDGVTNRWGQVHDIPNLFVSDGSIFTSSAAANPTLTIVALAIRQADHIAERMRRGGL